MPILNIEENDFLDRTEKLLGKDNRWEAHIAQQVPLPRSSSPYSTDNQPGSMEQLEPKTEHDMDIRDFLKDLQMTKGPLSHPENPK